MECRNSIPSKKTESLVTLNTHKVDVFIVVEANLTEDDIPYYQFEGYTIYLPY